MQVELSNFKRPLFGKDKNFLQVSSEHTRNLLVFKLIYFMGTFLQNGHFAVVNGNSFLGLGANSSFLHILEHSQLILAY